MAGKTLRILLPAVIVMIGFAVYSCVMHSNWQPKNAEITGDNASSRSAPEKDDRARANELLAVMEKLRPLFEKIREPEPSDWLAQHSEPGQTFREYLRCDPERPIGKRRVIYILPLGEFTPSQRKIVNLTADFMSRYFGVPVKFLEDVPLSVVPDDCRRVHPEWGDKQILTTYVLDYILRPRLPDDGAALIAFTASDLWPGEGWNFVFGQASLRARVGVWSIYRNGDPDMSAESFRLCLLRTMKTATHETGHMFSMMHCILYECNMCGSNHRAESDRRPIALCPECLAKVCWAARLDPIPRYEKLAEFCRENGLENERQFYEKCINALASPAK